MAEALVQPAIILRIGDVNRADEINDHAAGISIGGVSDFEARRTVGLLDESHEAPKRRLRSGLGRRSGGDARQQQENGSSAMSIHDVSHSQSLNDPMTQSSSSFSPP